MNSHWRKLDDIAILMEQMAGWDGMPTPISDSTIRDPFRALVLDAGVPAEHRTLAAAGEAQYSLRLKAKP